MHISSSHAVYHGEACASWPLRPGCAAGEIRKGGKSRWGGKRSYLVKGNSQYPR